MKLEELKYFICFFTLKGHPTWRMTQGKNLEQIEDSLKFIKKGDITKKKLFEFNRLTGTIEEF